MSDYLEIVILGILSAELACDWHITAWQKALLSTVNICFLFKIIIYTIHNNLLYFQVVFIGMMISGSLWGKFGDSYGRRMVI